MTEHPITPPPELVQEWSEHFPGIMYSPDHIATQAARWGADLELEACVEWLRSDGYFSIARHLRAARCPKSPSLKERALEELKNSEMDLSPVSFEHIRRALEALPDD